MISFLFANLGLSSIITFSVPVLMFLYPLSITLILLALCGKLFHHDRAVYNWVIGCTLVASVYDLLRSLPDTLRAACHLDSLLDAVGGVLPLAKAGLGWICPTLLGLVIGLIVHFAKKPRTN